MGNVMEAVWKGIIEICREWPLWLQALVLVSALGIAVLYVYRVTQPSNTTTANVTNGGVAAAGNGNASAQTGGIAIVGNGNNVSTNSQKDELKQNEGVLIPGDEPSPQNSCDKFMGLRPNSLTVLLGGHASLADKFPHTILTMAGEPLLVVDRDNSNGSLVIKTLRIFDEQGNRVAQVISEGKTNELFVAPQSFIRFKRPDHHTLVVYDRRDNKILDLQFLNKDTLSVQGIFRNYGRETIISKDSITINPGNNQIIGSCFAYNGSDFSIE